MNFLGEELDDQAGATPFSPRCTKDRIEELLFASRRDLFSALELVFFDTTSIYFEGQGGTIGQRGFSKDHRPDLKQMVVGAVIDDRGRPVCCEIWPGNTADVKTLLPVADRLRRRFGIQHFCIVADRGMISSDTVTELEKQEIPYTDL
jgi:transposase